MSAREDKERGRERETSPGRLPDTTPQVYPGQNYDFTLQATFEMQKSLGQLTQAIETLSEDSKKSREKLDKISHIVYAAGVVVGVLSVIGGWVLGKVWELIVPLLQAHKP